jgi:3-hydroxyacyl-CoA dehydrogenase
MDWKKDFYRRITPAPALDDILATNTSGLSMEAMAEELPWEMRSRFSDVYFFNPPRNRFCTIESSVRTALVGQDGTR